MPEMQFDFNGLIQLLAGHLYSEKRVFIRELIQNAHDGIQRRAAQSDAGYGRIDIETRPGELQLIVRDNGIGMDRDDLVNYLATIGGSLTRLNQQSTEGLIGQFGIGFLSAFVVAKRVEVRTRKVGAEEGWLWENDGSKDYRISEIDLPDAGTTVIVQLKGEEDRGLIQEEEVRDIIRRYADMLLVPIHLNRRAEPENTMRMPWEKTGLTPEELRFDCHLYVERVMRDRVLEAIPIRLSEPVRADGTLYITRVQHFGIDQPRTMRVFHRRMFLADNVPDILPVWSRFVNGVINTPDLQPTAARDNFVRDEAAGRLREALGDAIITHLSELHGRDPDRFARILQFHNLGIKAASYYYESFFAKFAKLLTWRTNNGESAGKESPIRWRTLPEILGSLPRTDGRPQRLPCFTTTNTASQYMQMANAAGSVVVDASHPFEAELLDSYTQLPDVNVRLVHVDREDDPTVFEPLDEADDLVVAGLAEEMALTLRPSHGDGQIRVEARRFKPPEIAAVIRSDARTRAQAKAHEVQLDPDVSDDLREMALELARLTAHSTQKLTINADNSLIRRLAGQDKNNPDVVEIMRAVYNGAVLQNQQLVTPEDAQVFSDQFQRFMARSLDFLDAESRLRTEQDRIDRLVERLQPTAASTPYVTIFMITPYADQYRQLVNACRRVVEGRWGCQLLVASDWVDDPRLLDNIQVQMSRAHAFIAEATDGNPNVMFELGGAFFENRERPIILLRRSGEEGPSHLPTDIRGLVDVAYPDVSDGELEDRLEEGMRRNAALRRLLDDEMRERYISSDRLRELTRFSHLPPTVLQALAERFPTQNSWAQASRREVANVLGDERDLAPTLITRVLDAG
jgi:molecular chaperone HtpG